MVLQPLLVSQSRSSAGMRRMEQTRDLIPNSSPGVVKRRRTLSRQKMWVVYSETNNGENHKITDCKESKDRTTIL